jgi:hypothetical protein
MRVTHARTARTYSSQLEAQEWAIAKGTKHLIALVLTDAIKEAADVDFD